MVVADIDEQAKAFIDQMNEFHTYPQPYDTPLERWLHEKYAEVMKKPLPADWSQRYFSPSSATKCSTELFAKATKMQKDDIRWKPHQRRYMAQGTQLGDWLQFEILLCERHFKKMTGKEPRFKMGLVDGNPAFENFVYASHPMEWNGHKFNLNGTCDGVMVDTETGESILLEIKSKQSTAAKTSLYSMREPEAKHVKQTVCYGEMYGIDKAIIVYVNGSKVNWFADDEAIRKTPDMRAFGVTITEEMREEVFDHFADTCEIIDSGRIPPPDLREWAFSEYKDSITKRLTDEEFNNTITANEALINLVTGFEADSIRKALDDIKRRRAKL